ncbi:MAG: M48 family metallopeptidase [Alphaproteobacteria bacterium]|nr:M48 family metallopeptidase [Alphaproteobacteria bacterium]
MKAMEVVCGERTIPLTYKPNPRSKRLSLRFSSKEAKLILTTPPFTTDSQIKAFLQRCKPWLESQLKKVPESCSIQPGEHISLYGTIFKCALDPLRRKPALCKITQTLHLPPRYTQKDVYDVFKKVAMDFLIPLLESALRTLGQEIKKVTIRDTTSRWGSCSARKTISLNWRLILAPPEVAEYVCIHEAVHLIHMNHSKDFWATVGKLCPSYKSHRKWLKTNGQRLMRV